MTAIHTHVQKKFVCVHDVHMRVHIFIDIRMLTYAHIYALQTYEIFCRKFFSRNVTVPALFVTASASTDAMQGGVES